MFGLYQLSMWLFAAADKSYSFQNSNLQMAVDICKDARELASAGKQKEACDEFMSGIVIGRPIVQRLQESASKTTSEDDPTLALDWLVSSYVELCRSRGEDWVSARKDAWAACMYSMYNDMEALDCMLTVCRNTDDLIGEIQTLRQILACDGESSAFTMTQNEIKERIRVLEKELGLD